ncbi:MAG: creatininase family protein [Phycisphaerales bacterium]|nr:creatininase family protein [Phycisphaerales bacterium]
MNDFVLAEQDHKFISSQKWEVAVLPFGATEPHGYHMPYGTDNFQCDVIGRHVCEHAYKRGAKVLLLPTMPFGVNTNHLKIPGGIALSVTPTTLLKLITDLVDSLERQGIRKLVLLNGHGGNELKPFARELFHKTSVFIAVVNNWFNVGADQYPQLFKNAGEHADEVEASMGLAYFPELMKMHQAGDGATKPTRFAAISKGWVSITRPWQFATTDTGMGDPRPATAEKGRQLMKLLEERLGDFLYELAKAPMDEKFPY